MAGIFEITNLSDFLTKNVHPQLYPRLFVMSPNGKLVAYSRPYYIADIKAEAAIVAMAWKTHPHSSPQTNGNHNHSDTSDSLTIETEAYNILARTIQSDLLMVLIGYKAEGHSTGFKVLSEEEYEGYAADMKGQKLEEDVISLTSRGAEAPKVEALMLQRRKLDLLAETVEDEAKVFEV